MPQDKNYANVGADAISMGGPDNATITASLPNCLKEGKPMADDGELYSSVQDAQDAASSWVFVPPGTFNESVTINTDGLTLAGSGRNTVIDGGTTGTAIYCDNTNTDITIQDLSVKTSGGSGNSYHGIQVQSTDTTIKNVTVIDADNYGIVTQSTGNVVLGCRVESADIDGIYTTVNDNADSIIANCIVGPNVGNDGIGTKPGVKDFIFSNNIIHDVGNIGITLDSSGGGNTQDCIVNGNRIINVASQGVYIESGDNIIANNRISDSGNNDIDNNSTSNVLDGNLTGASN